MEIKYLKDTNKISETIQLLDELREYAIERESVSDMELEFIAATCLIQYFINRIGEIENERN